MLDGGLELAMLSGESTYSFRGVRNTPLGRGQRTAEDVRELGQLEPFDVTQHEHSAAPRIDALERVTECAKLQALLDGVAHDGSLGQLSIVRQ